MSDRSEMEAARQIGLAKRHESRLQRATYTAAEVKVLTEAASKVAYALGRKDAGEEIAAALKLRREQVRDEGQRGWPLLTEAWTIALDVASQPLGAASDATSGVPGHPEVYEAVRSPQEAILTLVEDAAHRWEVQHHRLSWLGHQRATPAQVAMAWERNGELRCWAKHLRHADELLDAPDITKDPS